METRKRYHPTRMHLAILLLVATVSFIANELLNPMVPSVRPTTQPRVALPQGTFDINRIKVPANDLRTLGSADAPITIVEFADYECPYCLTAQATVDRIIAEYEGRVRLVFRDFPLGSHSRAVPSAVASRCAGEQGAFWPYHRRLWEGVSRDRQQGLADQSLVQYAAELNLDTNSFRQCLDTLRHVEAVEDDFALGKSLAIQGIPTFYVNGRPVVGVVPYVQFAEVIDEALAQQGAQK